jgi:hypothetical protein
MEGKMETYQALRMIDQLNTAVNNLQTEVMRFVSPSTMASGEIKTIRDESVNGLMNEQIHRINAMSEVLHKVPFVSN